MIRTKEELLDYNKRFITQNFNEEITGMVLNRLLRDMIETMFSIAPGGIGTLIKAPGNILEDPQVGDWRVYVDEKFDLCKEKYTNTGWISHEKDLYDATV